MACTSKLGEGLEDRKDRSSISARVRRDDVRGVRRDLSQSFPYEPNNARSRADAVRWRRTAIRAPRRWRSSRSSLSERQTYDVTAAGGKLRFADMTTPAGLRQIASHADAIGPSTRMIITLQADGTLGQPTALVHDAHAAGLELHPYVFRPENYFLAKNFWQGSDSKTFNESGAVAEIRGYIDAGIDAFFTDDPAIGHEAPHKR